MTDDSLIASGVTAVITTVVGLIILRVFRFFEKRDKTKDDSMKDSVKLTTDTVKIQLEKVMKETFDKNQGVHVESNVQLKDKITQELQDMNNRIKSDLDLKTDIQSKILLNNIGAIENKLTMMINALDIKTTMTIENVSKLRVDVLEIQKELDSICDKLHPRISKQEYKSRNKIRDDKELEIKQDDNA